MKMEACIYSCNQVGGIGDNVSQGKEGMNFRILSFLGEGETDSEMSYPGISGRKVNEGSGASSEPRIQTSLARLTR